MNPHLLPITLGVIVLHAIGLFFSFSSPDKHHVKTKERLIVKTISLNKKQETSKEEPKKESIKIENAVKEEEPQEENVKTEEVKEEPKKEEVKKEEPKKRER